MLDRQDGNSIFPSGHPACLPIPPRRAFEVAPEASARSLNQENRHELFFRLNPEADAADLGAHAVASSVSRRARGVMLLR